MEIQFTIGVSDKIQIDNSNDIQYTEELITMNQFINYVKEGRSFAQFLNPELKYNLICFDFQIDYIKPRSIQDIMSWFYLQPTAVLYTRAGVRAYLLYYVEDGFTKEEFLKLYALLMYVVYSHEDLDVLLDQNDLSFLVEDIQYIGKNSPVIKTEYNPKNTISIDKLNQLYKLNPGCNNYNDLYDKIVLPYFKQRFDKSLFSCIETTTPTTTIDNEFFNEFKTYYFQCNQNDRTIRKLAKHFNLTRYRSEQYIKQCLT
ncbi:MAG: hypothetical protein PHR83_01970 [Paludibacter sp.]|nr:hypothetical protein [Paludibacter sp.]